MPPRRRRRCSDRAPQSSPSRIRIRVPERVAAMANDAAAIMNGVTTAYRTGAWQSDVQLQGSLHLELATEQQLPCYHKCCHQSM